jgi:dethiobiotin synthetase
MSKMSFCFSVTPKEVENLVVEGAGGWMVPVHRTCFVSDFAVL